MNPNSNLDLGRGHIDQSLLDEIDERLPIMDVLPTNQSTVNINNLSDQTELKADGDSSNIRYRRRANSRNKMFRLLNPRNKKLWIPRLLFLIAGVVLITGIIYSYNQWEANRQAINYAKKVITLANNNKPSPAPSTIKPSTSALASYTVAPNMPKYLIIPSIKVYTEIHPVGLTPDGAIGVPDNVYNVDWYNKSGLPGQSGKAMLIDGHVSSWTAHGVFYDLKTLSVGNLIEIEMGNDTTIDYKVVKTQIYAANNVDMNALLSPVTASSPGLNLITCTGNVIAGTNSFSQRIAVFAKQD